MRSVMWHFLAIFPQEWVSIKCNATNDILVAELLLSTQAISCLFYSKWRSRTWSLAQTAQTPKQALALTDFRTFRF